jgi:hypothetical protein
MSSAHEPTAPVCGFCGRGPDDVERLIQGLTAWICDGCVAFCHGILQQVDPPADGTAAEAPPDPVMAGLAEASTLATSGDRAAARARYEEIWTDLGPDGDPLHVVTLAHQFADLQDDPQAALDWDLRALAGIDGLTDERAQQYHHSLRVEGLRPSLHLNVADNLARLGRPDEALAHLELAEKALPALPDDGYGAMIRGGVTRLRARLGSAPV